MTQDHEHVGRDEERRRTPDDDVRWPDPDRWAASGSPSDPTGAARGPDEASARPPVGGPGGGPAADPYGVPWSWADGLALIAWWLIASMIVGTIAVIIGVDIFNDRAAFLAVGALANVVTLLGALVWLAARGALTRQLIGVTSPVLRYVGLGAAVGVGAWVGMTLALMGLVSALGIEELPTQESIEMLAAGDRTAIVVGILLAVVLAPIVEELIYRSVLFQGLRDSLGVWPAIILSGAIFGAIHLETILQDGRFVATGLIPMLGITLVGAFWAWILHRTGSLIVPIIGHAVFNGIAVVLALLTMRDDGAGLTAILLSPMVRALTGL